MPRILTLVTLVTLAACGGTSPRTTDDAGSGGVTILEAPCDGGAWAIRATGQLVATFMLPASFDPQAGDYFTATACAASCGDAGMACEYVGIDVPSGAPQYPPGGWSVQVECKLSVPTEDTPFSADTCHANMAFLHLIQ